VTIFEPFCYAAQTSRQKEPRPTIDGTSDFTVDTGTDHEA